MAQAIAAVAGCGSAVAKTFGTIIIGRSFVGVGVAAGNVLTVNLISDIFCRELSITLMATVQHTDSLHQFMKEALLLA